MRKHYMIIILTMLATIYNPSTQSVEFINVSIGSTPENLDPFFARDSNSQNINRLLHGTIIDFDQQMNIICRLCESFSEKIEKNGKHIISVKLKSGQKFWDGSEVTSQDVKNSWKYFTETEKIKSIYRFAFGNIKEVQIIDRYNLNLVYEKFALDSVANLVLFKIIKINDYENYKSWKDIIGSGTYEIVSSERLEVKIKSLKTMINFKVVSDETTLALKLLNKEIDLSLNTLSERKIKWLRDKILNEYEILETESTNYSYINFNHKKELFKDKKIRKALSHLVPRELLAKYKLGNSATLAKSMYSKGFVDLYIDSEIDNYDPKLAKKLIEEAGFEFKKDGYYKEGKKLKIDWRVSNSKSALEIVETIAQYFSKNNIEVNIIPQEWGTFMRAYKNGDFDIILANWIGFTGGDMLNYVFHSDSMPPKGANRGYYSNPKVDNILSMATNEKNLDVRNKHFKNVLTIVNEDYAYLNLWHPKVVWITRKCLSNILPFSNGSFLGVENIKTSCK